MVTPPNYTAPLSQLLNDAVQMGPKKTNETTNRTLATTDAIKELILRENLRPGDILPTEITLCEILGVSRSSVREALRKLETLDIVSVKHGSGTFVGSLSLAPLVETLAFRSALSCNDDLNGLRYVVDMRRFLDLGCAEEVVRVLEGTEQPYLQGLVDSMVSRAEAGQMFQEEDIQFHMGLMAQISNPVIEQLVHSLWIVHMATIPRLNLAVSTRLIDTARAHQHLLDAAIAGDIDEYRAAVNSHYDPLEEILHQHSEHVVESQTLVLTGDPFPGSAFAKPIYRIPSLIQTCTGRLIACFDVREDWRDLPADFDIAIITSDDGGKTWSKPRALRKHSSGHGFGDASLINDPNTGRLLCWYTGSSGESYFSATTTGPGLELWLAVSEDDGNTWTHRDMSHLRPRNVAGMFTSSGNGVVMSNGAIVQPFVARICDENFAVCAVSTDGGTNWLMGEPVGPGCDENKVVEVGDGRLLMHIRATPNRFQTYSHNNGLHFDQPISANELIDPACNGGLTRVGDVLVASMCNSPTDRTQLSLHLSFDEGTKWTPPIIIDSGATAYSVIAPIGNNKIGVLWEADDYQSLQFTSLTLSEIGVSFGNTWSAQRVKILPRKGTPGAAKPPIVNA